MRRFLVAAVAAAVPIVWSAALLELPRELVITAAMVPTSVVFWSNAVRLLARPRSLATRLAAGLLLGAVSPVLCAVLMTLLLMPLWPLLLVAAGIPYVLPMLVLYEWQAFVPVGAATGVIVALLASLPTSAERGAPATA